MRLSRSNPTTETTRNSRFRCLRRIGADGIGDLGRRERPDGDLIEERLEQVVVVLVEEQHVDRCRLQRARRAQSAESGADDHDARACRSHGARYPRIDADPPATISLSRSAIRRHPMTTATWNETLEALGVGPRAAARPRGRGSTRAVRSSSPSTRRTASRWAACSRPKPQTTTPSSASRPRRSRPGAWFRRRGAARSCGSWARSLRAHKEALGRLVSLEAGKILSRAWAKCRR